VNEVISFFVFFYRVVEYDRNSSTFSCTFVILKLL
jgi:hypothetical protein